MKSKLFWTVFAAGLVWETVVFLRFPQQAWMFGFLSAWYSSKGLVMYRDYLSSYPPLVHLVMIPLHRMFGYSQYVTINLAYTRSLAAYLLLAFSSYKWLKGYFRLIPIIIFLLLDPYISQNIFGVTDFVGIVLLMILILFWSWHEDKSRLLNSFLIGFFSATCILSTQILVASSLTFFIFFLIIWLKEKKDLRYLILYLAGFGLPCVVIFAWLIKNGVVGDFIYWTIKYNLEAYPGQSLGKSTENLVIFVSIHLPILLYCYYFWVERKLDLRKMFTFIFILSAPVVYWFAVFHIKRFQIDFLVEVFLLGFLIQVIWSKKGLLNRVTVMMVLAIILGVFVKYAYPRYVSNFSKKSKVVSLLYQDDPVYEIVLWLRKNTVEEERLLVIADGLIYFESDRLPVNAKAIAGNIPFAYNPMDEYRRVLEQRPPDYWVVDERIWERWNGDFNSKHLTDEFQKILDCEEIVFQSDYVTIRKHKGGKGFCGR